MLSFYDTFGRDGVMRHEKCNLGYTFPDIAPDVVSTEEGMTEGLIYDSDFSFSIQKSETIVVMDRFSDRFNIMLLTPSLMGSLSRDLVV